MMQNDKMVVCSHPLRQNFLVPVMDSVWAAEVFGPRKSRKGSVKGALAKLKSLFLYGSYEFGGPEAACRCEEASA